MYLAYRPEGQDTEQEFHFHPRRTLRFAEMEAIERRTGWTYDQFLQQLLAGSVIARRALLWTFLRRQHPTLKIEDIDFTAEQVELRRDTDEIDAELAALADMDGLPEADRAAAEAMLRAQRATAPAPPGPGKAQPQNGAAATG